MAMKSDIPASRRPLRIGIVGAGLVGSAAVLALSRLEGVSVMAFEKSPVPREAGAWISLPVTGLKVLTKLIPSEEINAIVYRPPDKAVYVTRFWRTGQELVRKYSSVEINDDYVQGRTHREPLLKLITKHHPQDSVRYGSRVTQISVNDEGAEIICENGESAGTFDLVVAADGLYSSIRRQYLSDHQVTFKGAVAYRAIFPKTLVAHIHGLHDDSSAWRRNGEVVFLSELGLGMYGIVIIRPESREDASRLRWEHSIGIKKLNRLRELYKDWDPIIAQVLEVVDDIQAYPLESGPWMEELHRDGRIAFIGDAAHPTAGAYGAGAAMGFCDGWALRRALQGTRSRASYPDRPYGYNVAAALQVFQAARAPFLRRVERQMALDKEDAQYVAAAGEDEEEWIARFDETKPQDQWLTEHDVELEIQNAIMAQSFEHRRSLMRETHL